ncbi:MAG: hypothetical protein JWN04_3854 [Myxococcaceae bacterium]|nr:hypothetical protein [Myxococcaceae bacterium]
MRLIPFVLLAATGCTPTVYRDTWRPTTQADTYPVLLAAALAVDPEDVAGLEAAHAQLIGYHATTHGYATRAASVGGTHWFAVRETSTNQSNCTSWPAIHQVTCTASTRSRPTKIAVVRVEPADWKSLPPHLVPPANDIAPALLQTASQARYGCDVNDTWGSVTCSNEWKLYAPAEAPTYEECVEKYQGRWYDAEGDCEQLLVGAR